MLFLMALLVVPSMAQYQRPETLNKPPETFTEPLATDLVINGDFEAGSLTGWTVRDQAGGDGSWFIQRGTMSPESGFLVPAPPQGSFAAMTDQFGPGSHILYQDI